MDPADLRHRTHRFALNSIRFVDRLPETGAGRILGNQYLRSSTSVNANYRAARRARSRREFVAKIGSVLEEADESLEWLELIRESKLGEDAELLSEAKQLVAIFSASLQTARAKLKKPAPAHPL